MDQIFYPADILLPGDETDMGKWSVIACDQFTSEPEYWEEVEQIVGDAPSAFRITLPEVYLDSREEEPRLKRIRESMKRYMDEDLFVTYPDSVIYIEREDSTGTIRPGIVGAIDLEQYDYHKGSRTPVRATEGTILGRIPSRLRVRNNASIETSHIMMLIDDPKKKIIEGLAGKTDSMKLIYDFDLMKGGGHIKGWLMDRPTQDQLIADLRSLADAAEQEMHNTAQQEARHAAGKNIREGSPLIYAVGDGNHSLATAKEYYEQLKKAHPEQDFSDHPARFALVEVVNLHSPALEFEAIHRIVTEANTDHLFVQMTKELGLIRIDHKKDVKDAQSMVVVIKGEEERFIISKPSSKLTVGSLQNFLDKYTQEHSVTEDVKVDYIHGRENLKALTWKNGSMGFLLPDMHKSELFPSVEADGALPRKTFSMGHAEDKRYYTECRKIKL